MVKENPFSMRKSQEHLQFQCAFASKIMEVDMQKTEKKNKYINVIAIYIIEAQVSISVIGN